MRRALFVLARNWIPLLGALALSTMLYAGLVVAQDTRSFPGPVAIALVRPPANATLLEPLREVTLIRYRAPVDIAGRISADSFHASVDLSGIVPEAGGPATQVRVALVATDDRIDIIDWQPRLVPVRLDPVLTKPFTVTISRNGNPEGLSVGPSQTQPSVVTVSGATTRVRTVNRVEGRVTIDGSDINIDTDVDLLPLDERGAVVTQVELKPERVHVKINITRQQANRNVPIVPDLVGGPPDGYRVRSVTVEPLSVLVTGEQPQVVTIDSVKTQPIDVTDHTGPFEARVGLALPVEVTANGVNDVLVTVDLRSDEGSQTFQAGVVTLGAERDLLYSISIGQVLVALGGPVAALDAVDAAALTGTVDVRGLEPGAHDLQVTVHPPTDTQLISVSPQRITVTIVRPDTPSPSPQPTPALEPSPSVAPTGDALVRQLVDAGVGRLL